MAVFFSPLSVMNRLNWDGVRSRIYDRGFRKKEIWAKGLWERGMERGLGGVMRFGMLCLYYIYVHNNNNTVYILGKREKERIWGLAMGAERNGREGVCVCVCWRIYLVKTANNVKLKKEPNLHCYCCAFFLLLVISSFLA